ncbi:hypothetical protein AX14_012777 [Amanita brunnescens Koide BX004]|nr:hypothetical protein AX14_012777 [Amanita brunnescens Koide BX004]
MVSAFFEVGCDLRNALAGDVIGFHMDQDICVFDFAASRSTTFGAHYDSPVTAMINRTGTRDQPSYRFCDSRDSWKELWDGEGLK